MGKAEAWYRQNSAAIAIVTKATTKDGVLAAIDTEACSRCNATGIYHWGATADGAHRNAGRCFRCQGTGLQQARG